MHQALAFVLNFYFILHNNFLNKAFRANLAWFALSDRSISYLVYFPTPATFGGHTEIGLASHLGRGSRVEEPDGFKDKRRRRRLLVTP